VSEKTYERLNRRKKKWGHNTFDSVIQTLLRTEELVLENKLGVDFSEEVELSNNERA